MKIKFINAVLGGDYSALDIAITVLATVINENTSHEASITDTTFHRRHWRKHLSREIDRDKPDLIAISTNTLHMKYVDMIGAEIKNKYGLPILLGGHHASRFPKETASLPYCDWVIAGDGELTVPEFLDCLEAGHTSFDEIDGICYRKNGELFINEDAKFTEDIDNLPIPDYDLWADLDKYFYFLQMLYLIGSRGCPYKCTYCDAVGIDKAVKKRYFRVRDPRVYAREIAYQWEKYKGRGVKLAQLFDPVFTFDKQWIVDFCDEYRATGAHKEFRFSAFSRIDNLDEEKIEALGRSGCAILRVGIEAGDENIRNKVYHKYISDDRIKKIFKQCKSAGIRFTGFYILGGPGETKETMNKTIQLARELDAERSAFFIYKPFTEAGINQIMEYGGWINEEKWASADNITFDAVVESPHYTTKEVERLQHKAYFLTFVCRRLLRMIRRHPIMYFVRLFIYITLGKIAGLDHRYLLTYYHIYSYDNVDY